MGKYKGEGKGKDNVWVSIKKRVRVCLLYTSDAADE